MKTRRLLLGGALALAAWLVAAASPGCGRSDDVMAPSAVGPMSTGGGGGSAAAEPIGGFEPCAEVHDTATLMPVSMFITVDTSGSMADDGKWTDTAAAFTAFFQDSAAAGLQVALRFWPDPDGGAGCDDQACDADACAQPQVPLGSLSDSAHQQALVDLFSATTPDGGTPMSAALEGAAQWAQSRVQATGGDERVVILLVTDGEPHGCDENIDHIAAIAQGAYDGDGVLTYAVGLEGSAEAQMNAIAQAGGTQSGYFIGSGNAEADLLAALEEIRGQAVQCSFPVPDPAEPDRPIETSLVSIKYTASGSGEVTKFPKISGASECGPDGGWYYDDEAAPSTITLCPQSCSMVQADEGAVLDVAIGCECEIDPDCPTGTVCVDGRCLFPCTSDADCPADEMCREGRCVPRPGDPCNTDTDCPAGMRCIGRQCTWGEVFVGGTEAVQGGAFSCSVAAVGLSVQR